MLRRTFTANAAQNRQVAGIFVAVAALNALIGLIHTLEPTRGWPLLTIILHGIFFAYAGILHAACEMANKGYLAGGTIVAMTIPLTQVTIVITRPEFLGWVGTHHYVIVGLAIGVFAWFHVRNIVARQFRRPMITVTHMVARPHATGARRHRAV